MEWPYLVGFGTVGAILFFLLTLFALVMWSRLKGLEDFYDTKLAELSEKAEPKALSDARLIAEETANRVDTAVADLRKFREGVHAEIQRFYGIMRRNERAAERVETVEEAELPREIDAGSHVQPKEGTPVSRAQLRQQAREAGHKI